MKTSARNQFSGVIKEVIIGAVNAEVVVELNESESIVAAVTKESVETLGIKPGISAIALVKAPQIIVVSDFDGYKISARNQLSGKISEIIPGAVNSEI
ncbi:MAG: TOBE domain-containing protein, partial [Methylobacter sp.]